MSVSTSSKFILFIDEGTQNRGRREGLPTLGGADTMRTVRIAEKRVGRYAEEGEKQEMRGV